MAARPPARTPAKLTLADLKSELKLHVLVLGGTVGALWLIELVDVLLGGRLDGFGIRPRSTAGLVGILFAPLLHAGFGHLAANTLPLLVLGSLVMLREVRHFLLVSAAGVLLGGLGTWLVGRDAVHLGASGVVFAYFGFLLLGGWFQRSFGTILVSVVVLLGWGTLILGVLPTQSHVSWEGHLFGFLAGALCAWLVARPRAGTR